VKLPRITPPVQYGDAAIAIYVRPEATNGEPERRTKSAISAALARAREITDGFPGFKVRVGWAGHGNLFVRGGSVYLTIGPGGRREYAQAVRP
jgi:hypothetical protein